MTTVVIIDEIQCCDCGVYFGIEHGHNRRLLAAGPERTFYCPNGCAQHYIEKCVDGGDDPDPGEEAPVDANNKVIDLRSKRI
jgi:hypothetical protein